MTKIIITYDLCAPGRDYSTLIKEINKYPKSLRVTESTWVISTNDTCVQVRDRLFQHMDSNDRLFVAVLTGVAAWFNTMCDGNALKTLLES